MVLLPESNELSLADLRQMAARQQHQIEAHQQLLVAKEQRLKFLKQQEARHHQGQPAPHVQESDRLRHLRERVELQELKLRRLRALRGQVEQHKSNNSNLGAELESIRALFNEKEKELSMAVAKVEELTRQLEDVRRGDIAGLKHGTTPSPAALEFQKLKRELLYRSKLNEQQNARIAQQRETLAKRQSEISQMDQRIAELQQRLQKKRLLNQQLSSHLHAASRSRPRTNIAAVEPLKRAAQDVELVHDDLKVPSDSEFTPNKKDPKYQTLPYNTKFPVGGNPDVHQKPSLVNGTEREDKPPLQNGGPPPYPEPPKVHSPPHKPPPPRGLGALSPRPFNSISSTTSIRGPQQRIVATTSSGISSSSNTVTTQPKANSIGPPGIPRSKTPVLHSNHQVVLPPTVMTSGQPSISRTIPQTPARQHPAPSYTHARLRGTDTSSISQKPIVPPKPGTPSKPVPPPRQIHGVLNNLPKPDTVDQALSVLKGDLRSNESQRLLSQVSPTTSLQQRLAPSVYGYPPQKTIDSFNDHNRNQSSETESRSSPPNRLPVNGSVPTHSTESNNVHVSLNRRIGMPPAFYFPENQTPPSDLNGGDISVSAKRRPFLQEDSQFLNLDCSSSESDVISSKTSSLSIITTEKTKDQEIKPPSPDSPSDHTSSLNSSQQTSSLSPDSTDRSASDIEQSSDKSVVGAVLRRVKKGNLKTKGGVKNSRRVSFDPLALLLDAALEGELELVKKTAKEVPNPSAANDEGITALHNAICAGHLEIVKFLVEFGCDVNAQDSDGWTPLHCAASCNNLSMVKYLVERGACIFATTLSDHETAAEKCEEDEEGFDGCSEYLYSMQEKLGILNGGVVYALYDYESQNSDELSFRDGDQLVVLRKGDDLEREWWWSKLSDREGYVPRNLLGLHPRVTVKRDQ
ncbi:apoptosis-stimulating of p53 protein 1-like isoform X2 [Uloborus diversus]|uniref:apoptosis-stimulating of p53 protein 1-like isoform X2 n=1 Tax=Uloborus diversus TaxID=327109 RepID=UPI0024095E96|nr:apoptosis-stimulating of p53 protein 1-like isoform X2 [Uloborus diversus]